MPGAARPTTWHVRDDGVVLGSNLERGHPVTDGRIWLPGDKDHPTGRLWSTLAVSMTCCLGRVRCLDAPISGPSGSSPGMRRSADVGQVTYGENLSRPTNMTTTPAPEQMNSPF